MAVSWKLIIEERATNKQLSPIGGFKFAVIKKTKDIDVKNSKVCFTLLNYYIEML